ncbi:MAG: GNAT superfamily N-acetyltransferase [Cellvibrionaceae bacterium]|jgi:GNAT superfamily N-acetyltransferase
MPILIEKIDYKNDKQASDLVRLLDIYAQDKAGGGQPLPDSVKQTLASNLEQLSYAVSLIAYDGEEAIGLLNGFQSFSTFANEPLINIHDLFVLASRRGEGIAQQLLLVIEEVAKARGCCKLTLEVLSGNQKAQDVYKHFDFAAYSIDDTMGEAVFWQKKLS